MFVTSYYWIFHCQSVAVGFSCVLLTLFCVLPCGKARGEDILLGQWIWRQDFDRYSRVLPPCGLELTTKKCQTHHRVSGKSRWSFTWEMRCVLFIPCSVARFHENVLVPFHRASWCSGSAAGFILNILGSEVGRATACSHNGASYCSDLLMCPTERRIVPYDIRRMTPSESSPSQLSHRTQNSCFTPFVLRGFCRNALCQFTPLLNLRSPVVVLTLLSICSFQSPAINWPTVGVAAWRTSRRVPKYAVAIDRQEIAQLSRYS